MTPRRIAYLQLLVVAVLIGAVVLFPSLGLLFALTLRGHLDPHGASAAHVIQPRSLISASLAVGYSLSTFPVAGLVTL